jgi:hypothetical protein
VPGAEHAAGLDTPLLLGGPAPLGHRLAREVKHCIDARESSARGLFRFGPPRPSRRVGSELLRRRFGRPGQHDRSLQLLQKLPPDEPRGTADQCFQWMTSSTDTLERIP